MSRRWDARGSSDADARRKLNGEVPEEAVREQRDGDPARGLSPEMRDLMTDGDADEEGDEVA